MTTATLRDERRGNGWGAILAGWLIAAIAIGYQVGGVNVTPRPHAVQRRPATPCGQVRDRLATHGGAGHRLRRGA